MTNTMGIREKMTNTTLEYIVAKSMTWLVTIFNLHNLNHSYFRIATPLGPTLATKQCLRLSSSPSQGTTSCVARTPALRSVRLPEQALKWLRWYSAQSRRTSSGSTLSREGWFTRRRTSAWTLSLSTVSSSSTLPRARPSQHRSGSLTLISHEKIIYGCM